MDGVDIGPVAVLPDGSQRFSLRTPRRAYGDVHFALAGDHQVDNAVVAVRLTEQIESAGVAAGRDAIVSALATVRWPGRLERIVLARRAGGAARCGSQRCRCDSTRPSSRTFARKRARSCSPQCATRTRQRCWPCWHRSSRARSSLARPTRARPNPLRWLSIAAQVAPELSVEVEESPADALTRAWLSGLVSWSPDRYSSRRCHEAAGAVVIPSNSCHVPGCSVCPSAQPSSCPPAGDGTAAHGQQ